MPTLHLAIYGKEQWMGHLKEAITNLAPRLLQEMQFQMVALADYVRETKLSGQVLNRRSGDLSRSVTGQAEASGTKITGTVGTKGIPYAAIHEFGAVFTREVRMAWGRPILPVAVTFHYPERAFLRPSAMERTAAVVDGLRQATREVFNG